jgi:DNA polymerase III delta prime subunit
MNTIENSLWVEKYRPTLVKDVVLPDRIKTIFQSYVDRRDVPNLLLIGSAGTGKTTIARALGNELGSDILFINASDDRGIANLRTKVKQFASITSSELGLHKLIIMDEGDNLSPDAIMALRGFIEQCSSNARFIFTANYEHKFPDPIKSRLQTVTFSLNKDE